MHTDFCDRDKNLTLLQNYRRLGLTARLNAPAGGVEKPKCIVDAATAAAQQPSDSLHINSSAKANLQLEPKEVRVERDSETGKIVRVIRDDEEDDEIEIAGRKRKRSNPLGDPLTEIEEGGVNSSRQMQTTSESSPSDFVKQLEQRAAQEEEAVKKRRPRQQSKREEEWIQRLIEKHGDNIQAMVWDRKLNPMQQSEGDLRRRIRIYKERHSISA